MNKLTPSLTLPADQAARRLLGCSLIRTFDNGDRIVARIVETEAYDQTDAASHSYKGRTPRTDVMFGPAGYTYVYFTYGMHYCFNVTVGKEGEGAAVLIRAVEIVEGEAIAQQFRRAEGVSLGNGPAKLCQALAIDRHFNGHDLTTIPFTLHLHPPLSSDNIAETVRIGIRQAKEVPWRFYVKDSPAISHINV